ncbi:MAG: hypothetical protein HY553_13175 [Elusimicrobia bacterium]|nr:hypothetical protein [Elusimicrobiota bacterium]
MVALLALGSLFWLPRFQERLPGGPAPCPTSSPEPPADAEAAPAAGLRARLAGAVGEARLLVLAGGARVERHESPEVRWVLSPLAAIVGLALAAMAFSRASQHLWRRPKAAVVYGLSGGLGLALAFAAVRAATYAQTIRLSSKSVEFETSEALGAWRTKRSVSAVGRVAAWKSTGRISIYAVSEKPRSGDCAFLFRARWLEPDLLSVLNASIR